MLLFPKNPSCNSLFTARWCIAGPSVWTFGMFVCIILRVDSLPVDTMRRCKQCEGFKPLYRSYADPPTCLTWRLQQDSSTTKSGSHTRHGLTSESYFIFCMLADVLTAHPQAVVQCQHQIAAAAAAAAAAVAAAAAAAAATATRRRAITAMASS